MTLVSFVSAKGSPGVTQTVMGLASVWPRAAVVADLDPVGGDVALRHRAADGEPLDVDTGVVSLGAALRGGAEADLDDHLQRTEEHVDVLVGVASPGQIQGLGTAWPHLGVTLRQAPADVLVDGGRFVPGSPITPVIERSSALVFVVRSEIEALAHLRERLRALVEPLRIGAIDGLPLGVIVVGDTRDTRGVKDVDRLFASAGIRVTVVGVVAHDPKTVLALRTGTARNAHRSSFVRSLHDVASGVQTLVHGHALVREGAR